MQPYLKHNINALKKTDPIYNEFVENKPLIHSTYCNTQLHCFLVTAIGNEIPIYCISIRTCREDPISILREFLKNGVSPLKRLMLDRIIKVTTNEFIETKAYLIRQGAMCAQVHLIDGDAKEPDIQKLGSYIYRKKGTNFIPLYEKSSIEPYNILLMSKN